MSVLKYIALGSSLVILSGCTTHEISTTRHRVVSVTPNSTGYYSTYYPAKYYYRRSYFPNHHYVKYHSIYPYSHPYRYSHYQYYRW